MALAILLAFSRAAWGGLVVTSAFMLALMVLTSRSPAQRSRIIVMALVAVSGAGAGRGAAVVRSVAQMFKQRASFDQSYDDGRFGRFGRHILGAEMALDLPFGIGPLQFNRYFPEDTHNSYLNAFMSGGWLSGVCYPALVFTTVMLGFRYVFVRVPWQKTYLAIFAAFLGTVGESFHHRHRPLAAFLDDAGRDVGHVRRRRALSDAGRHHRGAFLCGFAAGGSVAALRLPSTPCNQQRPSCPASSGASRRPRLSDRSRSLGILTPGPAQLRQPAMTLRADADLLLAVERQPGMSLPAA
jgi:hypothetical protein